MMVHLGEIEPVAGSDSGVDLRRQRCLEGETVESPGRILVVDDLPETARILRCFLRPKGYEIQAAYSGEEALARVDAEAPDLILLDLVMPEMDGFEVCRHLKHGAETRHIPVVIITGLSDRDANVAALEAGADDFIIKPFDVVVLEARIHNSLKTKRLQDRLLDYQHRLELQNETLEHRVQERTAQVELIQQITVFSLAKLAESRDTETGDHVSRIRAYVREIALELMSRGFFPDEIDDAFVTRLYLSSPLHDIGKVGIPDRILLKPGKLMPDEFNIMKRHATIGGDTLRAADLEAGQNSFLAMGRDIAYYHHEKWDGSGYPEGLKDEEIPLPARILAIADVYDALSSKRPYKEPFSHEKSMQIIREGRGSHFDPVMVDAFFARDRQIVRIRSEFQDAAGLSPIESLVEEIEARALPSAQ